MSKVAVIGLDGATWRILDSLIEKGELPFFKKLKQKGIWGNLETTTPPVTASAWPSFMTGKKPESHGIYGFNIVGEGGIKYANGSYIQDERFWEVASNNDKRCCIMNVPVTYPVHEINGVMVSGMTTPSEDNEFTYPSELKDELLEGFDYEIEARGMYSLEKEDFLEEIDRVYEKRKETINLLKDREGWDLFVSVLRITDILTHFYPEPEQDEVRELFKDVDSFLEELVDDLTDKDYQVIFMSDHGMVMSEYSFDMNKWLQDQDYLVFNEEKTFMERFGVTKSNISDLVNKMGFREFVKKFVPENVTDRVPDGRESIVHKYDDGKVDTEETDFFSTGMGASLIFDFTEDEEKLDDLKAEMKEIKGPDGRKVFDSFEFKDESDYRGRGPALTARLNPEFVIETTQDGYFGEPSNAYHSYNGIFGAIGDEISSGKQVDANIIDVAPTILHLLDLEIPDYMEGDVLTEVQRNPSKPSYSLVSDLDI